MSRRWGELRDRPRSGRKKVHTQTLHPTWEQRIERARELAEVYPASAEILRFYANLAEHQRELHLHIEKAAMNSPLGSAVYFLEALDLALLKPRLADFLKFVREIGPAPVTEAADQLALEHAHWDDLLRACWARVPSPHLSPAQTFLVQSFLQPAAEYVAARLRVLSGEPRSTCLVCDSEPAVAVLREEGLGARRSLVCSFCGTEWAYVRARCPACGENRNDALCVYTAEQFEHVRVDACETCKTYIKTVDLTKNGLAIPVVDELASLPLTLWAEQNGYTKIEPNLMTV